MIDLNFILYVGILNRIKKLNLRGSTHRYFLHQVSLYHYTRAHIPGNLAPIPTLMQNRTVVNLWRFSPPTAPAH